MTDNSVDLTRVRQLRRIYDAIEAAGEDPYYGTLAIMVDALNAFGAIADDYDAQRSDEVWDVTQVNLEWTELRDQFNRLYSYYVAEDERIRKSRKRGKRMT